MEKQWCKAAQGGRGTDPVLCKIKSAMEWEISSLGSCHESCLGETTSYTQHKVEATHFLYDFVKLSLFMIVKTDF